MIMKKKNFYSNVDFNLWQTYSFSCYPEDPEGEGWQDLLDMLAEYDSTQIEWNEDKERKSIVSVLKKLLGFLLELMQKDEFNGAYKK